MVSREAVNAMKIWELYSTKALTIVTKNNEHLADTTVLSIMPLISTHRRRARVERIAIRQ